MSHKLRLAVVLTHPVQYYAPVFQALALEGRLEICVFYTWSQAVGGQVYDVGFGKTIEWDTPLRTGYAYQVVPNIARPDSSGFLGLRNPELVSRIEAWGAEALLIFGWNKYSHFRAMSYFKGRLPVFFRGDSTLLDPMPTWRRVLRKIVLRMVYRKIDHALAVGQDNRDYFLEAGVRVSKISISPHCVNNEFFADRSGDAEHQATQFRRQLRIPEAAVVVLFAGKFQSKKVPDLLIKQFTKLKAEAHLVLVGNGELEPELRMLAEGHDHIHFMPFQNQSLMPAVYRLANVFVLPSMGPGETWGLAVNEAMASGRPVIVSDRVGCARDLVIENQTGWVVRAGDPDDLGRALKRACQLGAEGLAAHGAQALRHIAEWSVPHTTRAISDAVIDLSRRASCGGLESKKEG